MVPQSRIKTSITSSKLICKTLNRAPTALNTIKISSWAPVWGRHWVTHDQIRTVFVSLKIGKLHLTLSMSREWGRGIIQSGGHCHPASHCHDVIHMWSNIITVSSLVITLAIRREDGKVSSIYSDHNMLLPSTNLCQARPGLSLTHAARWCFTGTQPPLSLHLVAWPPHPRAIIYLTLGQNDQGLLREDRETNSIEL